MPGVDEARRWKSLQREVFPVDSICVLRAVTAVLMNWPLSAWVCFAFSLEPEMEPAACFNAVIDEEMAPEMSFVFELIAAKA